MRTSVSLVTDMMTLARLHAALDSVIETEQLIAAVDETSPLPRPAVARVRALVGETRELLRRLLRPPEPRHAVGDPSSGRRDLGGR